MQKTFCLLSGLFLGCSSDTAEDLDSHSAKISVAMQVGSSDVVYGMAVQKRAITNDESPSSTYEKFIADAAEKFGAMPSEIQLESLHVELKDTSQGVVNLNQVFAAGAKPEIEFVVDDLKRYSAGEGGTVDVHAPKKLEMPVTFAWQDVAQEDAAAILSSDFVVAFSVATKPEFAGEDLADLHLILNFEAFK